MEKFARLRFHRLVAVAFCAVASCALVGTAAAQTVIPSVPFTISAPGVYVLEKDLVTNRPETSIVVNASNVTIDFQGHSITSTQGASSLNAHGIYAKDRANLQIRNGRLNGFYGAIWLIGDYCSTCTAGAWYNSANDIIENMRISNSYYVAVYMNKVGPFRLENNDIDIVHGFGTTNGGSALVYGLYVLNA